ncbi:hypothetical protein PYW07_006262 [Mythimna separata]|uniref:Peptidase M14 domain-containing protein n=1 Tax=Mythimna separata TaxID=271217 RepID=A0AAD7YU65_MYTSE|nr:hypothetical protein PYW07_006262 [Mythimna separata]
MLFYLYFITALCFVAAKNEEYKGYKVYNIALLSQNQQEHISELKNDLVDFWRRPNFQYGVVGKAMVPPSLFNWFEEKLEEFGIEKDVYIEDVYEFLTKEESKSKSSADNPESGSFDVKRYHSYDDIIAYLRTLQTKYPNAKIELVEYGITEQKRPIVYLKVTGNTNTAAEKPIIVVESGIIPRDWVTIPAALNIVEKILGEQRFLNGLEWIVVPVLNPDGYEYTRSNLRLWEKSRSTSSHLGAICPGVNLNRNFDMDWLRFDSSSSPCSPIYGGGGPFSETETEMIRHIIDRNGSKVKLYLSLQNNGGYISYPWNYERAANGMFVQNHRLGLRMVNAMSETYNVNVGSFLFDRASGTSSDYARDRGVLYTFNIDVVQRENGVVIAEEDVGSIVDDVWKAVVVAADEMIRLYV